MTVNTAHHSTHHSDHHSTHNSTNHSTHPCAYHYTHHSTYHCAYQCMHHSTAEAKFPPFHLAKDYSCKIWRWNLSRENVWVDESSQIRQIRIFIKNVLSPITLSQELTFQMTKKQHNILWHIWSDILVASANLLYSDRGRQEKLKSEQVTVCTDKDEELLNWEEMNSSLFFKVKFE